MKITVELFGASRDFSNKDHLEFEIREKIEVKDRPHWIPKFFSLRHGRYRIWKSLWTMFGLDEK